MKLHLGCNSYSRKGLRSQDCDSPTDPQLGADHAIGFGQPATDRTVVVEREPGSDQHTTAARWRRKRRRVSITQGFARRAQPVARRAATVL